MPTTVPNRVLGRVLNLGPVAFRLEGALTNGVHHVTDYAATAGRAAAG
jgi:hypothetical protein